MCVCDIYHETDDDGVEVGFFLCGYGVAKFLQ